MSDESGVLGVWRAQLAGMDAGDADAIRACCSDDLVLTHMTGYQQPLDEWLDGVRNRSFVYHRLEERSVEVTRISDTTAQLVGRVLSGITDDGSGQAWPLRIEQDYVRRDGRWLCQSSRVSLD